MTGRRLAVLIGNGNYSPDQPELASLRCPRNDVEGLAEVLKDPAQGNFELVERLIDEPHYVVAEKINEVLKQSTHEDLVLLYYSGHGKPSQLGKLHLATSNTKTKNLEATALPVRNIREYIDGSLAQKVVLILDCCYAGKVGDAWLKGGIDDAVNTDLGGEGSGVYVISASSAIETAQEKEGETYSVFTKPLIEGIRAGDADANGDGMIDVEELFRYIKNEVAKVAPQTPRIWNFNVTGDVFIANNPRYLYNRHKITELKAADALIPLLVEKNFDTLKKLIEMLLILDHEKALEPLQQLKDQLVPHTYESVSDEHYALWKQIDDWTQAKKSQLFQFVQIEVNAQVLNKNDEPTTAISVDENWRARVEWNVPALHTEVFKGSFELSVFLESFAGGSDLRLNPEPIHVPVDAHSGSQLYSRELNVDPRYVPEGTYKMIAVVTLKHPDGKPTPVAGFYEHSVILFYRGERPDISEPIDMAIQVDLRGESGQPSQIISVDEAYILHVEWKTPALARFLPGAWKISSFLEPLVSGSEITLTPEPWIVPSSSGPDSITYSEERKIPPGVLQAGVYKLVVTIGYMDERRQLTTLAGFLEGPVVQVFAR